MVVPGEWGHSIACETDKYCVCILEISSVTVLIHCSTDFFMQTANTVVYNTVVSCRTLLSGSDLSLAFGRRYGLVGRNGTGKTTLLRLIASRELRFPSHLSVLHVEQEVEGGETSALESVLECDRVREDLLARVKR